MFIRMGNLDSMGIAVRVWVKCFSWYHLRKMAIEIESPELEGDPWYLLRTQVYGIHSSSQVPEFVCSQGHHPEELLSEMRHRLHRITLNGHPLLQGLWGNTMRGLSGRPQEPLSNWVEADGRQAPKHSSVHGILQLNLKPQGCSTANVGVRQYFRCEDSQVWEP